MLQPFWKYCKCKPGQKVPYPKGWQNAPLDFNQIPNGDNFGLLTGPFSSTLAIDFDGPWAADWYEQSGLPSLPETIGWTSGKYGRAQFAFYVPEEAHSLLKTIKFDNGKKKPDNEGIEFRWTGAQSVLPPSIHPDTGVPYHWVSSCNVLAELPLEIIEFIYEQTKIPESSNTHYEPLDPTEQLEDLLQVMSDYKMHYNELSYHEWMRTTFACMNTIGVAQGKTVMAGFYPEQSKGEYDTFGIKFSKSHHPPTIGSLIERIRRIDKGYRKSNKIKNDIKF